MLAPTAVYAPTSIIIRTLWDRDVKLSKSSVSKFIFCVYPRVSEGVRFFLLFFFATFAAP